MSRASTFLIAALLSSVVPAAPQDAASQASQVPSIVTTGEATVRRAPDQAFVTVAVESRAKSPRDAQRLNAEAMTSVQQRITSSGIAKDAIRTLGYNIQQEFDFQNGKRVPRDYLARNALEVRVDQVDRTGEIIDAAVQAGATSISAVRFELKDRAGAEREALRMAVQDARARADAAAAGAGRTVDRVLRIEDVRPGGMPPRPMMMSRASADAAVTETPVEPGTIEIRAHAVLTVSIK
jgi:uncharacterized protein YggE